MSRRPTSPAADLFSQDPDPVATATASGATFERRQDDKHGNTWRAVARRRGRPVPLAMFDSTTQHGAATMFCAYFHLKA